MKGRGSIILLIVLAASVCVWAQTAPPQAHPSRVPDTQSAAAAVSQNAPAVPASNPRVQKLASEMRCMCGCTQVLNECNHQGINRCITHDTMIAELERRVASGESNSLILQSFVQEYGPAVLLVPPAVGFDLTAWLMPIFASLAGLTLALVVVQRWRERGTNPATATAGTVMDEKTSARPDLIERARAETQDEDY